MQKQEVIFLKVTKEALPLLMARHQLWVPHDTITTNGGSPLITNINTMLKNDEVDDDEDKLTNYVC
jgi:hypothetical protein